VTQTHLVNSQHDTGRVKNGKEIVMPLKSKQNTTKRKPKLSSVLDEYSTASIKRYLRNKEADKERAAELRLSPLTNEEVRKRKEVGYGRDNKKMDTKRKNTVMSNYTIKKKKK
jgi:hypothetical protein